MSHYYTADGQPAHFQPTKPGAKAKLRPTTVADAKLLGLFPSVSTVLNIMSKPSLERAKLRRYALAAEQEPRSPNEEDDTWFDRLDSIAFGEWNAAADLGTAIHDGIEKGLVGQSYPEELRQYVEPALGSLESIGIPVVARETVAVNSEWGYAGKFDVAVDGGIVDFKSQKTKPGKPFAVWESHRMQIAAYHRAFHGYLPLQGWNVFISTTEPGRVETRGWALVDLLPAWNAFKAALTLWKYANEWEGAS